MRSSSRLKSYVWAKHASFTEIRSALAQAHDARQEAIERVLEIGDRIDGIEQALAERTRRRQHATYPCSQLHEHESRRDRDACEAERYA